MQETVMGHYNLIPDHLPAEGNIHIVIQPIDIITHWRRCGLMADFIASFYANHAESVHTNLISTVFNELLENATKYSRKRDATVTIHLRQYNSIFKMHLENYTSAQNFFQFKAYFQYLLSSDDLESLYFEKLEQKEANPSESGLGLLILLKDYPIKMGAQFIEDPEKGDYKIITEVYYYLED